MQKSLMKKYIVYVYGKKKEKAQQAILFAIGFFDIKIALRDRSFIMGSGRWKNFSKKAISYYDPSSFCIIDHPFFWQFFYFHIMTPLISSTPSHSKWPVPKTRKEAPKIPLPAQNPPGGEGT